MYSSTLVNRRRMVSLFGILSVLFLSLSSVTASAQVWEKMVRIKGKQMPFLTALKAILAPTGVTPGYTDKALENTKPVDLNLHCTVREALKELFSNQPVTYKISFTPEDGDQLTVIAKDSSPPVETKPAGNTITLRGWITGKDNEPLEAITVSTTAGKVMTQTHSDGTFRLENLPPGAVLYISAVNYGAQQIAVRGRTYIRIIMQPAIGELDKTVVTGYGKTPKRAVIGNVAVVNSNAIIQAPGGNPLESLQGRTPGLVVTPTSGIPGAGFTVELRGQQSVGFIPGQLPHTAPLYVVDNVPLASDNTALNTIVASVGNYRSGQGISPQASLEPWDIESITILKDAAATAIFGSKGAAGVVMITTKKGTAGKTRLSLDLSAGRGWNSVTPDLFGTPAYLNMRREAVANTGNGADADLDRDIVSWGDHYTNYVQVMNSEKAWTNRVNLAASGGNKQFTWYLSGSGYKQTTTNIPDLYDARVSGTLSLNYFSPDSTLHLTTVISYAYNKGELTTADPMRGSFLAPNVPQLVDNTGTLIWEQGGNSFFNIISLLKNRYQSKRNYANKSFQLEWKLPGNLLLKLNAGAGKFSITENDQHPIAALNPALPPQGAAQFGFNTFRSIIGEPQLEWTWFKGRNQLTLLGGATFQQITTDRRLLTGTGYNNDLSLQSSDLAGKLVSATEETWYRHLGFFGRLLFNDKKNKYYFIGTARRDGSSRFGEGHQMGNFLSAGFGWLFYRERFFTEHLPWLSFAKLRISYGSTGNDQIGDYRAISIWTPATVVRPYNGISGYTSGRLPSPDVTYEINRKFETGIDLSYKDLFFFTAAFYRNLTSNQLVTVRPPSQTGYSIIEAINMPGVVVENKGLELTLEAKPFKKKFSWTSNFNITLPSNKLLRFDGLATSPYAKGLFVGSPLTAEKGYPFLGVDPATGIYATGDSLVEQNTAPRYYGGLENTFSFKGFKLVVFFQFVKQLGRNPDYFYYETAPGELGETALSNLPVAFNDRWRMPGDHARYQKIMARPSKETAEGIKSYKQSTDMLINDAFIKLQHISFSWELPECWLKKMKLKGLSFYVQAQNLFTITPYKGADVNIQNPFITPVPSSVITGIHATF